MTIEELCDVTGATANDIARWRSQSDFPDDLLVMTKHLNAMRIPEIFAIARANALDTKASDKEQRHWMFVFLKLIDSPLAKTTTFTETL